jgi:hypothetical protein
VLLGDAIDGGKPLETMNLVVNPQHPNDPVALAK